MADDRKKDHIDLAFEANSFRQSRDSRFEYDPLHGIHPTHQDIMPIEFGNCKMKFPIWISSMTGGTDKAKDININLAKACNEFGLAMGLGSCRKLIENPNLLPDFDVKKHMGQQALYCNIGIAQLEQYINDNKLYVIRELIDRLHADGLIIHINPMQEWMQKEGDRFLSPAINTIKATIEKIQCPIIVKEVGQGMGLRSLKALFQLPLLAIEFGAFGGTNFAKLETLRNPENFTDDQLALQFIGHDAEEMLQWCNEIFDSSSVNSRFRLIISGGIKTVLDGYYYISKSKIPAVYGQASNFLKYAQLNYESLQQYLITHTQTLMVASQFLRVK